MSDLDLMYWDREIETKTHWVVRVLKKVGTTVILVFVIATAAVAGSAVILVAALEAASKMGLL